MATTYDLHLTQGQRYLCGFRWVEDGTPRPLADYSWRAQVRRKEALDAELLLDLTPYMALANDGVTIQVDVPATVTYALPAGRFTDESAWDLFLWPTADPDDATLLLEGAADLNRATSALA